MHIIKRFLCLFGWHHWIVRERVINPGYYDQERWLELTCCDCGKVEEYEG